MTRPKKDQLVKLIPVDAPGRQAEKFHGFTTS